MANVISNLANAYINFANFILTWRTQTLFHSKNGQRNQILEINVYYRNSKQSSSYKFHCGVLHKVSGIFFTAIWKYFTAICKIFSANWNRQYFSENNETFFMRFLLHQTMRLKILGAVLGNSFFDIMTTSQDMDVMAKIWTSLVKNYQ